MRLLQYGPNALIETQAHLLRQFLSRFWSPIPRRLDAAILIQPLLGDHIEAAVLMGRKVNFLLGLSATGLCGTRETETRIRLCFEPLQCDRPFTPPALPIGTGGDGLERILHS